MPEARRAALLVVVAFALPALPLFATLPSHPRIFGVLNDAAHAPVFGAFAVVVLALLRQATSLYPRRRYIVALATTMGVGALVELIQPFIGRGSEWIDLLNDGLGAITGLALAAWFETGFEIRRRQRLAALALLAAGIPILWPVAEAGLAYAIRAARFPTLLLASSRFDRYLIGARAADISRQWLPDRWHRPGDPPSLRVQLRDGTWPGIVLAEPSPDWAGYSRLVADLTNPDARPLAITIRIHDQVHDNDVADRFNRQFVLSPAQRQLIVIPLDDIANAPANRRLDLTRIGGLIVFSDADTALQGRGYYLTRIWLE